MDNRIIDPDLAGGMARNADAQQRMDALRRSLNHGAPNDKKEKLREACEGFEAIFIQKMWEQMEATVPEGFMHSKDEKIWRGMYNQELSKKMAQAGGIGLADMMIAQLGRNLEDAGEKALRTSLAGREPIPVQPAPLVPERRPEGGERTEIRPDSIYGAQAPDIGESGLPETEMETRTETPSEFDRLVERLEMQMLQPQVSITRVITNASSIDAFGTIPAGRRREPQIRKIARPDARTPDGRTDGAVPAAGRNGIMEAGPSMSPAGVSSARTSAIAREPDRQL
jgi:Rod binding domain-containing protein